MTTEDIEDNYEFKVVKRIIKKEFPFIKDMKLSKGWEEYQSLFFVDVPIDIEELFRYMGEEDMISPRIKQWAEMFNGGIPYLNMLIPYELKMLHDKANEVGTTVQKTIRRIQSSPSIPPDMKLPRDITISGWKSIRQDDTTK